MSEEIQYTNDSTIGKAMRRIRDYYPVSYAKLLALRWRWSNNTARFGRFGATDGVTLILNPEGINLIQRTTDPVGYMAFLLVHESLHALLNHGSRLSELSDHGTANEAADYIINAMIKEVNDSHRHKLGYIPFPIIEIALLDENLSGSKSVKELYTDLAFGKAKAEEENKENDKTDTPEEDGEDKPDDPDNPTDDSDDSGDHDPDEDGGDDGDEGSGGSADDGEPDDDADTSSGGGSSKDEDPDPDDDGKGDQGGGSPSDDKPDDDDADGESKPIGQGGGGGDPADEPVDGNATDEELLKDFAGTGANDTYKPEATPEDLANGLTDEDMDGEVEKSNEKIVLTEQMDAVAGEGGGIGLRDLEAKRAEREGLRWDQYLSEWLTARSNSGWNKPFNHVIYSATKLVCAGRGQKALNELVIGIDVSGSINDATLGRIMGSIEEALEVERPAKVYLVAFSHVICEVIELDTGDPIPSTIGGGGGTLFQPVWDWVEENAPDADGIVMLTDMYAGDFIKGRTTEPVCPVLFVSYGLRNVQIPVLPYGEMVEVTLN